MLDDEVDDRGRVFEAVRMVAAVGLVDELDRAAKLPIAFLDQEAVLRGWDHVVDVADHMHERDARLREGRERVDRITAVGEGRPG